MAEFRRITPLDVLFLRGNRLFGGPGEHGWPQMPPWPSVFAGAVASAALEASGRMAGAAANPERAEAIVAEVLGEDFALTFLGMVHDGNVYLPLPADLTAFKDTENDLTVKAVRPMQMDGVMEGLLSSKKTPWLATIDQAKRAKPETGQWMSMEGWRTHLMGDTPSSHTLIKSNYLWAGESRLGIARDAGSRIAEKGRIYTSEAVALADKAAFACGFSGRGIPGSGLLRLGGDGRGAVVEPMDDPVADLGAPGPGWEGFKMILVTPGIFPAGWLPPGVVEEDGRRILRMDGVEAELLAARIQRHEVVSGWDVALNEPKPAQKVVPAGSVYWFKVLSGDSSALECLRKKGLYSLLDDERWRSRRREGFGRVWFGRWNTTKEV